MRCPVCNLEMRMADRKGIEIDYCPQCRGIWLDRGELDKIIERSTTYPLNAEPIAQSATPDKAKRGKSDPFENDGSIDKYRERVSGSRSSKRDRYDDDDDDDRGRNRDGRRRRRENPITDFLGDFFDFD